MLQIQVQNEENYFLPEDGLAAKERLMGIVNLPTEGWYSAYNFSLPEIFDSLKVTDGQGIPFHALLDWVSSQSPSEKDKLIDLKANIKVSDITLTTAGLNSQHTGQIWHDKVIVKKANDGGEPWCIEGSTNISTTAFDQGNTMRVFRSQAWADALIKQFEEHKAYALANYARYQATIAEVSASEFNPLTSHDEAVLIVKTEVDKWQKVLDELLNA